MKLRAYKSNLIILLILFTSGSSLIAQKKDFNLWTGVQIEKEIINNLDVDLEFNNRQKDNLNQRDESFLDFGINYSIADLKLSLLYRFSNENEGVENYSYSNRFSYQLSYKYDIKRFRINLRSRYQSKYDEWFSSENGMIAENYLRNRIKLRYDIEGLALEPLVSYEVFTSADQNTPNQFVKQRISIGANYNLNKKNTVGIVFHIQNEKNVSNPTDKYILSLSYSFEL